MAKKRKAAATLGVLLLSLASCAADRNARMQTGAEVPARESTPPRFESRSGIPVLMDLPIIGFLFGRTRQVR